MTLAALRPRAGQLLWDVGAGAGSVGDRMDAAPSRQSRHRDRGAPGPGRAHRAQRRASRRAGPRGRRGPGAGGARRPAGAGCGLHRRRRLRSGDPRRRPGRPAGPAGGSSPTPSRSKARPRCSPAFAAHGGALKRLSVARADPVGGMHGWRARDAGDAMGLDQAVSDRSWRASASAAATACRRDRRSGPPSPRRRRHRADRLRALATAADRARRAGDPRRGRGFGVPSRRLSSRSRSSPSMRACRPARPGSRRLRGVGSLAEAAALGGCRRRRRRLVLPRIASAGRDLRPGARRRPSRQPDTMTVHFIGAGPGAADLITVRGRDLIARCPVCLYAGSLVAPEILGWCPPGARIVDTAPLDLDAIMAEMRGRARARAGRGAAAFRRPLDLERDGRADAPARRARHPLHGDARRAGLRRRRRRAGAGTDRAGSRAIGGADADLGPGRAPCRSARRSPPSPRPGATLAMHLSIHVVDEVVAELMPFYGADCPVAVVFRATWPDERVLTGTLGDDRRPVAAAGHRAHGADPRRAGARRGRSSARARSTPPITTGASGPTAGNGSGRSRDRPACSSPRRGRARARPPSPWR